MASDYEQEDDGDDLYSDAEQKKHAKKEADGSSGDEPMDEGADSGDEEDDDSESDLEIIIDKPPIAPKPTAQQQPQESKAIKIEAPPQASSTPAQAPRTAPTGTIPQLSTVPGTAYPAQKTSTIDVNGNPVYPPQGKPLLQVDMDADLAEEQKIWRQPGQDQSDFFNYGFDEFTWETYRQRQLTMANTLQQQKSDLAQMQQMMGSGIPAMPGMAGPGGNNTPSGPPPGPAGGNEQQQMEMMFQQMVAQGMDPSQMDFGSFMQMAGQGMGGGFGGPGGPGGPGGQQGGFQSNQGGGGGRGGRGGRGRGW